MNSRNRLIAAGVVLVLAVGGFVLYRVLRSDPAPRANADGYFAVGCALNDDALADQTRLDGADGPTSTRLMAEAQLLGTAGRTTESDASLVDVGNSLSLAVQRQDAKALPSVLDEVDGVCRGKDRTDPTASNEAALACALRASLASYGSTPKALGKPDSERWAQLRTLRSVAAAAEVDDSDYSFLSDDATAAYLAAAKPDPKGYAEGLTTLETDC